MSHNHVLSLLPHLFPGLFWEKSNGFLEERCFLVSFSERTKGESKEGLYISTKVVLLLQHLKARLLKVANMHSKIQVNSYVL